MVPAALQPGATAESMYVVAAGDTAQALGSGELSVLGTPRLLAWMEAVTCAALAGSLAEGETSVGTRMSIEHLKASAIGATVAVSAELSHVDGRLTRFSVVAQDDDGAVVGHGQITRVVVDERRFLSRIGAGPS